MTTSWNASPVAPIPGGRPTAEEVAAIVSGIGTIGQACAALRDQGWKSSIAGNRITVDDQIFVRFVDDGAGAEEANAARWVVYGINGRPTVWIVGTQSQLG